MYGARKYGGTGARRGFTMNHYHHHEFGGESQGKFASTLTLLLLFGFLFFSAQFIIVSRLNPDAMVNPKHHKSKYTAMNNLESGGRQFLMSKHRKDYDEHLREMREIAAVEAPTPDGMKKPAVVDRQPAAEQREPAVDNKDPVSDQKDADEDPPDQNDTDGKFKTPDDEQLDADTDKQPETIGESSSKEAEAKKTQLKTEPENEVQNELPTQDAPVKELVDSASTGENQLSADEVPVKDPEVTNENEGSEKSPSDGVLVLENADAGTANKLEGNAIDDGSPGVNIDINSRENHNEIVSDSDGDVKEKSKEPRKPDTEEVVVHDSSDNRVVDELPEDGQVEDAVRGDSPDQKDSKPESPKNPESGVNMDRELPQDTPDDTIKKPQESADAHNVGDSGKKFKDRSGKLKHSPEEM